MYTMSNALFTVPKAINEPVKAYVPGSAEHTALISEYKKLLNQDPIDVPMYIGSELVKTNNKRPMSCFHGY